LPGVAESQTIRPVRVPTPLRRRLTFALFAGGLTVFAPPALAQDGSARSFAATATASVKDAAASALDTAQDLTAAALDLIGIRYKWGGNTPETGLDCSGLVRYVFQQVTGVTLPRTARDMSQMGEKVAPRDLQPGDLVFFNTRRFAFSHVGIYLGDNRFVHAPRRGREVEVATLDSSFWQKRFNGARRMVGVLPELIPTLVSEAAAAPLPQVVSASEEGPPRRPAVAPVVDAGTGSDLSAKP
jgi:cell wall-associated NlpC family hydrolase